MRSSGLGIKPCLCRHILKHLNAQKYFTNFPSVSLVCSSSFVQFVQLAAQPHGIERIARMHEPLFFPWLLVKHSRDEPSQDLHGRSWITSWTPVFVAGLELTFITRLTCWSKLLFTAGGAGSLNAANFCLNFLNLLRKFPRS